MADSGLRSYTMAAEAAAEIVSQKLEILLSRPEWVGCFFMETLVKDAKAKLTKIQEFFSTRDRPSKSTEWSGRLLQAMYRAEDILDKFHLKVARGRHEALHIATRPLAELVHKSMLWRDFSKLVKTMEDLCQDQYLTDKEAGDEGKKEHASSSSLGIAPWEGQKLARLTNFWDQQASTNFVWHEAQKKEIMKQIGEEVKMKAVHGITILGEQGAGKTFLARWVYREAMYLGYDTRAWVHVPHSMDRQEFLLEILRQVDKLARGVTDFNEIKEMLSQKLANGKRFLIVLDDAGQSDEELLDGLAMIVQPESSQGHIITTTQDYWIARWYSDKAMPIKLGNLSPEESRKMLAMNLHKGRHALSLMPEEEKILNRFPPSPLCISLLGGLLPYAKEQERKALAKDGSKTSSVSDLLELSYHRLPVHLKPCFIYMALFPVASPILTRRLVRLWLAAGLLDSHCCDRERKKTPEEVGETFILELADRNVIDVVSWRADGSPKACQMLTSLYELICSTMMSLGFLHVHKASKSKGRNDRNPTGQQQQPSDAPRGGTKVRWLAEHTNIARDGRGGNYPDLNVGHIRSFLSFYLRRGMLTKDISTFLGNVTSKANYSLLRVLDLEGVYKPSLQGVLRKMVLLRYLGLRSTVLDSIPSEVADLYYLETFDIKHTNITYLPSSLWKARNLRHLHLNWFYIDLKKILKVCGDNVMALTKLQTLSGLVIGEVKENSMTGHMNSLTTLTTLKLFLQHSDNHTSGDAGETVAHWICSRLTNLQSLTLEVIQEAKPEEEPPKVADPAKEAEPTKVAEPTRVAKPAEEAEPPKEASTVAKPAEEAKPTEVAEPPKEASTVAKPAEEAKPTEVAEPPKEADPPTSLGLLPELAFTQHHELFELYLLGQLNKPIWTHLLPISLRVLTLSGSKVETDVMPTLGNLLSNLRTLRLLANSFQSESMRFIKDGFLSLKILKIWKLPKLKKVIIERGTMPHLQELEFRRLESLKTVEGIENCKELEKISVISQSDALAKHIECKIGKTTYLRVEKNQEARIHVWTTMRTTDLTITRTLFP